MKIDIVRLADVAVAGAFVSAVMYVAGSFIVYVSKKH